MARAPSKKQRHRELLVHKFMKASGYDPEKAEEFDRVVCGILGIDCDKNPPDFIGDILAVG